MDVFAGVIAQILFHSAIKNKTQKTFMYNLFPVFLIISLYLSIKKTDKMISEGASNF